MAEQADHGRDGGAVGAAGEGGGGTTAHAFDQAYWDAHWQQVAGGPAGGRLPNPHLVAEAGALPPGTALDAGCGEGGEARWLAARGWQVTAADLSAEALDRAAAVSIPTAVPVHWVEADLTTWQPGRTFDLVTTSYAHPTMPQLAFYRRLADWVAPGGTLLVVAHRQHHGHGGAADHPPAEATVTAGDITAGLDDAHWVVVTAEEPTRTLPGSAAHPGHGRTLHDVVVRARRRG